MLDNQAQNDKKDEKDGILASIEQRIAEITAIPQHARETPLAVGAHWRKEGYSASEGAVEEAQPWSLQHELRTDTVR